MRVTRIVRTRHLAAVPAGDLREHLNVRLTASREDRTLRAQNTSPAAKGLVWLTVTTLEGK